MMRPTRRGEAPGVAGIGIFWVVLSTVWTLVVASGMIFLWQRRHLHFLRIRGLPLSFTATIVLHLYWCAVQTGYFYLPLATPMVEYWIMSLYVPFGIALFHASNSRFLHVAKMQRDLFTVDGLHVKGTKKKVLTKNGLLGRFAALDYTKKILVLVGVGISFQLFLTVFMFLISRKFHSNFGIPGTEVTGTETSQMSQMARGWEWWPSVVWQFLWAWIFAPIILWRSRNINDTQGWRVQTIACCVASLHATPMWLIGLYVPAMEPINRWWIPPQWIALSIMFLVFFNIFLPCWEVVRQQALRQETLETIAQWQTNKGTNKSMRSVTTASTAIAGSAPSWAGSSVGTNSNSQSILSMEALEYVLARNPEPLQRFSALRDFSGENIAFLRSVAEWKNSLPLVVCDPAKAREISSQELVRERFNSALQIYTNFVSARDAEFQINLSSQDSRKLEAVFEAPARTLYGEKEDFDFVVPFEMRPIPSKPPPSSSHGSTRRILSSDVVSDISLTTPFYWGEIPEGFGATIFNDAEASIKYLVLTNTWSKFVKDRRCSIESSETLERGIGVAHAL